MLIKQYSMFEDKNNIINEALKNRLCIVEFINIISLENLDNSEEFKRKLNDEESSIIIYCNKLLFRLKEFNYRRIGNTINNDKVIKLLESNI